MSSLRNSSSSSNNGTKSSSISQKKPSFLVRFIKGTFFQIFVFFTTIVLLGVGYAAWTTLDRNDAGAGKPVTQTLMQGIIDNINNLNTRLQAVNPSGTTLSGSSVCIGGVCKSGWTTQLGDVLYGKWIGFNDWSSFKDEYGVIANIQRWNDIIYYQAYNSDGYMSRNSAMFDQANKDYVYNICTLSVSTGFPSTGGNPNESQRINCGNVICEFYTKSLPFMSQMSSICLAGNPNCNNGKAGINWVCLTK